MGIFVWDRSYSGEFIPSSQFPSDLDGRLRPSLPGRLRRLWRLPSEPVLQSMSGEVLHGCSGGVGILLVGCFCVVLHVFMRFSSSV